MTLAEACDGSPGSCPPSTAWVGYDEQAVHIAARHPVSDAASLRATGTFGTSRTGWSHVPGRRTPCAPLLCWHGFANGAAPGVTDMVTYPAQGREACMVLRVADSVFGLRVHSPRRRVFAVQPGRAALGRGRLDLLARHGRRHQRRGPGRHARLPGGWAARASPPQQGLIVWLDAADPATIERDPAGNVIAWKDKSGKTGSARQRRHSIARTMWPAP